MKLVQDVSGAFDLSASIDAYESELLALKGKIEGVPQAGGFGYKSWLISTAGVPVESKMLMRTPTDISDELGELKGCSFSVTGVPLWRRDGTVEISFFQRSEIALSDCPDFYVVDHNVPNSKTLSLTFQRPIDPASILPDGSQFVFNNGLVTQSVKLTGRVIEITTSAQVAGQKYTVTMATTIKGLYGGSLDSKAIYSTFTGYSP